MRGVDTGAPAGTGAMAGGMGAAGTFTTAGGVGGGGGSKVTPPLSVPPSAGRDGPPTTGASPFSVGEAVGATLGSSVGIKVGGSVGQSGSGPHVAL